MLQLCMWNWNAAVFPPSLTKTWNFWTCSRCVNRIYHLMISLLFCFQCQTILLGKNCNSYHLSYKHNFSFHQSDADTALPAMLFRRNWQPNVCLLCWGFLARVGLWFPSPFVLCFLDVFLAILWLLVDVAGQLAVWVPGCGAAPPALS